MTFTFIWSNKKPPNFSTEVAEQFLLLWLIFNNFFYLTYTINTFSLKYDIIIKKSKY